MHVDGPDASASRDFLIEQMVDVFANHPDNPYHCPDSNYDAPAWRFGALASNTARTTSPDEFDRLTSKESVDTPVLFLAGACNDWIGAPLQEKHLSLFPNGQLTVIPDAGHAMLQDNADATIAAIRAFLLGQI